MKYLSENVKTITVHVLFWIIYVISEHFANLLHLRFLRTTLLTLPILILATYFIALYVVPRFLSKNKWYLFFFWIVLVAVFVFYARINAQAWINYLDFKEYDKIPPAKMLKNIIRDYSTIALAVCIYIINDYHRKQQLNEALIKAKAEAEIKLLKGQLHPHFLFNSLNNIYSLALTKSDQTADSILKLTELLDYLVYRANMDKVALSKEVELLNNYIGLEQLRYGEKLKVESDIKIHNDGVKVAPLILLPFAENCFKHGGVGKDGIFYIKIYLYSNDKKLIFDITNSKKNGKEIAKVNGGVGLENIQKRLTLLYTACHQLIINDLQDEYNVKMEINF